MRPQVLGLLGGELEHEVRWKPLDVAFDLLVEPFRGHAVELGQIGVENDLLASDQQNPALDVLHRNGWGCLSGLRSVVPTVGLIVSLFASCHRPFLTTVVLAPDPRVISTPVIQEASEKAGN